MYKHNINNIGNERLPIIDSNSTQNQLPLKWSWCKDIISCLKHWGIDENDTFHNIDNAKNICTSKIREKQWCKENLVVKTKLRYYKEVINPNLKNQKYLLVVISSRKKINLAKITLGSSEVVIKITGPLKPL